MQHDTSPRPTVIRSLRRSLLAAVIALTAVAVAPAVDAVGAAPGDFTIEPGTLDFGPVELGDSVTLPVIVTNATAAPAAPDLSGSGTSGDFSMASRCNVIVAPGDSCEVDIRFSPSALGPVTGFAVIHVSGSNRSLTLTGEGVEPLTYALAPAALDFGDVVVGEQASLTATITNTSSVAATPHVEGTVASPFSFGSGTCLDTLLPGETCTGTILFSPTVEGASAALASITVDGAWLGSVALSGNGVAPVDVDPAGVTTSTEAPPTTGPAADGTSTTEEAATGSVTPSARPDAAATTLPRTGDGSTLLITSIALLCIVAGSLALVLRTVRRQSGT